MLNKSCRVISILLVLVFILTMSISLVACDKNEETDDPSKNAGKLLPLYNDDNDLMGYTRQGYNTDKQLQREDIYDTNQELMYFKTYSYDQNGNVSQETWYKPNGLGDYYYTYKYDENNNVIEKGYYPAQGNIEIYCFDSDGNKTDTYYYDVNDQLVKHSKLVDNEWKNFDADDNPID